MCTQAIVREMCVREQSATRRSVGARGLTRSFSLVRAGGWQASNSVHGACVCGVANYYVLYALCPTQLFCSVFVRLQSISAAGGIFCTVCLVCHVEHLPAGRRPPVCRPISLWLCELKRESMKKGCSNSNSSCDNAIANGA